MASITRNTFALALLCFLLIHQLEIYGMVEAEQIDCQKKCEYRCSKSWKQKMCLRACNTCCQRCNCVPDGPTASRDACSCYAKMTTHGGRLKCP
ncbi:gibberellin-regulated protein 2-like [Prosopis cineraria]|uniref:gibberellin-regulated protein 2-like n=1 Tax=Prosopis cineraria TaxID=364024 RepID=UPI00240EF973|nr:gibberellin-regulated protein 2-like [Prosopis cineraria]